MAHSFLLMTAQLRFTNTQHLDFQTAYRLRLLSMVEAETGIDLLQTFQNGTIGTVAGTGKSMGTR
jgi:hypothetical protein